ncbi:MAG: hypothetical protein JXA77_09195 [Bacteroidales bacterium]|nr:hypothetical protein [Bacteroidales bacterium]MBN2819617.1 hypothetical protein [Bacteroidales bacterium]
MKKYLLLFPILLVFFQSCENSGNSPKSNAEVVAFNALKCGCCWGWVIKYGNDTIKSDNAIVGKVVGYTIDNPVKVFIELGEITVSCSEFELGWDYFEVKKIVVVN